MNPHWHAKASARRYGGVLEDYLDIHSYMDSSKQAVADMRHRILTHTPWFAESVIPRVYGEIRTNSEGKIYSPKQVAYDHILEDFKNQIPATADWFQYIEFADWMDNGKGRAPSSKPLDASAKKRRLQKVSEVVYGG